MARIIKIIKTEKILRKKIRIIVIVLKIKTIITITIITTMIDLVKQ